MNGDMIKRVKKEANYMLETNQTVREVASIFHVSKSTVHKDLHERLKEIDETLFQKIDDVLKEHTNIRHIKGGESTKQKYLKMS